MDTKIANLRRFLLEDKRKSERLKLPVKIAYTLPPGKKWLKVISLEDIGGSGLKFATDEKIEPDAELNLRITLTDETNKPLSAAAAVLRCSKVKPRLYHIAVKFHKMNYQDRQRYVEYLCEKILLTYLKK